MAKLERILEDSMFTWVHASVLQGFPNCTPPDDLYDVMSKGLDAESRWIKQCAQLTAMKLRHLGFIKEDVDA